ncbi:MAG: LamG domain-containing protein [Phycisphaerae bacterium]|nr:LamG domain-containing protein [Phycisphaerae bacterium]
MTNSLAHTTCFTISAVAILGLALVMPDTAVADPNDGLVGYWSFDEGEGGTAHDYSGNENDGTIHGTTWTSGISGSALELNGIDGHVYVPDSDSLNLHGSQPFTLAAWIHKTGPDSCPYSYPVIKSTSWQDGRSTVSRYGLCEYNSGDLRFMISKVGQPFNHLTYSYGDNLIGRWLHLVGAWDGAVMRLYVNGAEVANKVYVGELGDTTGRPLAIGGVYTNKLYFPFNGIIDEVRVYDRALSTHEVTDLYWSTTHPDPQDDTTDGDKSDVSGSSSDPVNTATGSFFHQETDLSIPSRGLPLTFSRFYNSKAAAPGRGSNKSGQAAAKSKQAPPGRKTATSQPASTKDGERSSVGAKKHGESPAGKDQEQPADSSQPRPKTKETSK